MFCTHCGVQWESPDGANQKQYVTCDRCEKDMTKRCPKCTRPLGPNELLVLVENQSNQTVKLCTICLSWILGYGVGAEFKRRHPTGYRQAKKIGD